MIQKSMILKYEPSSEPLHNFAKWLSEIENCLVSLSWTLNSQLSTILPQAKTELGICMLRQGTRRPLDADSRWRNEVSHPPVGALLLKN